MVSRATGDQAWRYVRLALLAAVIVGLGLVLVDALANAAALTRRPCANAAEPLGVPTSALFVFGALGAFCLGGLLSHWPASLGPAGGEVTPERRGVAVAVHVSLAVFFTLGVVLVAYETWAEWDPATRWPITSFVRCADRTHTPTSLATAVAVSFLLGKWLWHPWRPVDADTGR